MLSCTNGFSQSFPDYDQKQENNKTQQKRHFAYGMTYFGNNLWNPGLKVHMATHLKEKRKVKKYQKEDKSFEKVKWKRWNLQTELGFFRDRDSFLGLFAHACIQREKRKPIWVSAWNLGIGCFRSFYSELYEVEDGNVKKVILPGRWYFSPTLSYRFGWKAGRADIFSRIHTQYLFRYNGTVLPMINIEFGFQINHPDR